MRDTGIFVTVIVETRSRFKTNVHACTLTTGRGFGYIAYYTARFGASIS